AFRSVLIKRSSVPLGFGHLQPYHLSRLSPNPGTTASPSFLAQASLPSFRPHLSQLHSTHSNLPRHGLLHHRTRSPLHSHQHRRRHSPQQLPLQLRPHQPRQTRSAPLPPASPPQSPAAPRSRLSPPPPDLPQDHPLLLRAHRHPAALPLRAPRAALPAPRRPAAPLLPPPPQALPALLDRGLGALQRRHGPADGRLPPGRRRAHADVARQAGQRRASHLVEDVPPAHLAAGWQRRGLAHDGPHGRAGRGAAA
ncbi:hypothetical protein LTR60_007642, partial [Cryomyces antarcticus]